MALTVVQAVTSSTVFNTTVTVAFPVAPTDGNYILIVLKDGSTTPSFDHSGLTTPLVQSTSGQVMSVFGKVASSDAASFTATVATASGMQMSLIELTDQNATPMDATPLIVDMSFGDGWPDVLSPAISSVTANAMHIVIGASSDQLEQAHAGSETDPSYTVATSGYHIVVMYKLYPTAGAIGQKRIGYSVGADGGKVSLVIKPSAGAPPSGGYRLLMNNTDRLLTMDNGNRVIMAGAPASPTVVVKRWNGSGWVALTVRSGVSWLARTVKKL